jgi:hypothetical protein
MSQVRATMPNALRLLPGTFLLHASTAATLASCACAFLLVTACVSVSPGKTERTVDGLTRIQSKRGVDSVFVAPGYSLAQYRRVMLDPVDIAFKKDWQRNHPEVTAQDIARIRAEGARMFRDVFARELQEKGGYALSDQPGPDVLRVTASIVDLDLSAPETRSAERSRTYVVSSGEMTLLAELRDSESGAILVRAADRQRGRQFGNLQIASAMSNSAEAQRAFAMWASLLRDALDAAKEPAATAK